MDRAFQNENFRGPRRIGKRQIGQKKVSYASRYCFKRASGFGLNNARSKMTNAAKTAPMLAPIKTYLKYRSGKHSCMTDNAFSRTAKPYA